MDSIRHHYSISGEAEITMEANPEDLTHEYLSELAKTPVNRLSIGIQSFSDKDLAWMNRNHHALQAMQCIEDAQDAGIENISIDLIYGTPGMSDRQWLDNLDLAKDLNASHLSAYSLTVEEHTPLHHLIRRGKSLSPSDTDSARHFEMLMEWAEKNDYMHYEISNLCRENLYARHNSGYWKGMIYAGIGPSAHSYDGFTRRWNISSNPRYMDAIEKDEDCYSTETLQESQKWNEYVMVSLRTMWGCDPVHMQNLFSKEWNDMFASCAERHVRSGNMTETDGKFVLTRKGKLIADAVTVDFFVE
jgi:oxygen-independent coproporphyrinogen-3 oxidase